MIYFLKSIPYLVALYVAWFDFPSKLLEKRYRRQKYSEDIGWARRWSSASDLIVLPLLSFSYAVSGITLGIASLGGHSEQSSGIILLIVTVGAFLVVACLLVIAMWTLAGDVSDDSEARAFGRFGFEGTVKLVKVVGVALPALLDLFLTFWL